MENLLAALKAAAEPTRLRLLALLEYNELTVSELTQILGQSQPRVSRHLKLMAEAGLVERFSEGTWAFYRVADQALGRTLVRAIVDLITEEDPVLARDLERLEQVKAARAEAAAAYFSENAAIWDTIRSLYMPEAEVEKVVLDLLGAEPIGKLLDIGTGTGRMLSICAHQIDRGLGVDMNREMLAVARANLDQAQIQNCQVRQGDMYHLGLPAADVDVAVIHQVLHFAEDPAAAVQEAARVLRPEGRLLIVDFAPHTLEFLRTDHAHRRLGFADDEVIGWCRSAGFGDVTIRHLIGGELTVTVWLAARPGRSTVPSPIVKENA
ncbi:metalloregulator ArsR/SmtB family transcription factor [Iodidimonas sp. SYSU 1G8]|uniref:ArsR/SmtB family transcription factor n=1 Tax=Iodidimonas sp. SYSU 1G8 TaxID=3133967 RepID=UPI0031FF3415